MRLEKKHIPVVVSVISGIIAIFLGVPKITEYFRPPEIMVNSARIYFVKVDEEIYQLGIVSEIANNSDEALALKGITITGCIMDILGGGQVYIRKVFYMNDMSEVTGDGLLNPKARTFVKVFTPLKFEMTIMNQPPPQIILMGNWTLQLNKHSVSVAPDYYGNNDRSISRDEWGTILTAVSTINIQEVKLKQAPIYKELAGKYNSYLLYNPDRSATIDIYGYDQTNSVKNNNGVMVFIPPYKTPDSCLEM